MAASMDYRAKIRPTCTRRKSRRSRPHDFTGSVSVDHPKAVAVMGRSDDQMILPSTLQEGSHNKTHPSYLLDPLRRGSALLELS